MPKSDPKKARSAPMALCALFAPRDADVKRETLHAFDDPEGYVKSFAARLKGRGITSGAQPGVRHAARRVEGAQTRLRHHRLHLIPAPAGREGDRRPPS
jgi:hypothetical protein